MEGWEQWLSLEVEVCSQGGNSVLTLPFSQVTSFHPLGLAHLVLPQVTFPGIGDLCSLFEYPCGTLEVLASCNFISIPESIRWMWGICSDLRVWSFLTVPCCLPQVFINESIHSCMQSACIQTLHARFESTGGKTDLVFWGGGMMVLRESFLAESLYHSFLFFFLGKSISFNLWES